MKEKEGHVFIFQIETKMGSPVDISSIITSIQYCQDKIDTVQSNKETCNILVDDLELIYEILATVDPAQALKVEKYKFRAVMNRLHRITSHAVILFDRCRNGKLMIKIKNIPHTTSIKEELQKLTSEIPLVISMLNSVFNIQQSVCHLSYFFFSLSRMNLYFRLYYLEVPQHYRK